MQWSEPRRRFGPPSPIAAVNAPTSMENQWRRGGVATAGPGGVLRGPATNFQRGIAGSESEFAARMSQRAREPGMSHSRFVNAWGNSSGGQRVTARDMARLAAHVISTYPQSYH
jgi:hypothetical protein